MSRFRASVLVIWLLVVICSMARGLTAEQSTPENLFKELKSLPQESGHFSAYYDLHGNANQSFQALMVGRFEFTTNICGELDFADAKSLPGYVASLYDVLATVKDPNSIPWLERRLAGSRRDEVFAHWLPHWRTYLRGAGTEEEKWLTGRERWAAFFLKWAKSETKPERRTAVLRTMQGWLNDHQTLEFFTQLEADSKTGDEDLLTAQLFLQQQGRNLDAGKLREAIKRLRNSEHGRKILLEYADEMKHEAFVPWLLETVEENPEEDSGNAQWILEAITFRRDVQGRVAWQKWAGAHGKEGRKVWMEKASSLLLELAKTNLPAAETFMNKAMYRWKSPVMLPTMERLADFKPLHSEIVGWINLTYNGAHHHTPLFCEQLRRLALRIQKERGQNLKDWAKRLMHNWDFLFEDRTTWEEFIHLSNSLV